MFLVYDFVDGQQARDKSATIIGIPPDFSIASMMHKSIPVQIFYVICLEGPQCIGILPILHNPRKIKTPPQTQKLRNSNSETPTQKLQRCIGSSRSENHGFRIAQAYCVTCNSLGRHVCRTKLPPKYF